MRRLALALLLAAGGIVGCGKPFPIDKVVNVADDDVRVNAAMEKAKTTVDEFIAALQNPKPSQSGFSIKKKFSSGKGNEHMWLTPVRYDGKAFHGTVNNEPVTVKTVRMGQNVTVEPAQISDWMYIDNRKLKGGFTIRALRAGLPADKKAVFDKSVPFTID
jgi:uncharacterized protein YegJ (DUF2314 family)